jgi:uracil phosphoribosyltransferase
MHSLLCYYIFAVLDASMLQSADRGYIVLDKRGNASLQTWVQESLKNGVCKYLYQLPLSDNHFVLPTNNLIPGIAIGSLVNLNRELASGSFFQTIDYGSKGTVAHILASQSRRSDISGPALQAVHQDIGRYLADQLVDHFRHLLVQNQSYAHVLGTTFEGVATVEGVLILPLMRGGEPMSRGVHQRFPGAKLEHYTDEMSKEGRQRLANLVSKVQTIIIVDSVINQGESIRRSLNTLQEIMVTLATSNSQSGDLLPQVMVLTTVMQAKASVMLPREFPRVRFFSLRISQNQYTGKGGTDTGNRLFGTI